MYILIKEGVRSLIDSCNDSVSFFPVLQYNKVRKFTIPVFLDGFFSGNFRILWLIRI